MVITEHSVEKREILSHNFFSWNQHFINFLSTNTAFTKFLSKSSSWFDEARVNFSFVHTVLQKYIEIFAIKNLREIDISKFKAFSNLIVANFSQFLNLNFRTSENVRMEI